MPDPSRALTRCLLALAAILSAASPGCEGKKPSAPLPADTVDGSGGVLVFESGRVTIEVPPGAVSRATTLTVSAVDSGAVALASPYYEIGPSETSFAVPVTVRIAVDGSRLDGRARLEDLTAGVFAGGIWQGIPTARFDAQRNEIVFSVDRFGEPEVEQAEVGIRRGDVSVGVATPSADARGGSVVLVLGCAGCGQGAPTCETTWYARGGERFGALIPRYVDAASGLGSDANPGTLALPWRTVSHGAASVPVGAKLVVTGPATYDDLNGESFPISLRPNVVIVGEGSPTLHFALPDPGLPPLMIADAEPSLAYVSGFVFSADPAPGAAPVDRPPAIIVTAGTPIFETIRSEETYGISIFGGEPGLIGCTLERWAAGVSVAGGSLRLLYTSIEEQLEYPGLPRAGVEVPAADRICLEGNTIKETGTGILVQGANVVALHRNTIEANDEYGVRVYAAQTVVGTRNSFERNRIAVFLGSEQAPPSMTARFADNTFERNASLGIGVAAAGDVQIGSNDWDGEPVPDLWYGPSPWVEGVDVAFLLDPIGPKRWWKLGGPGPSARLGASMGYDGDADLAVLFGGRGSGANLDDTWEFDVRTLTWNGPLLPPSSPPARYDAALTRSAPGTAGARCFLYGGHTGSLPDVAFDDLWVYDAIAADWTMLAPAGNPGDGRLPLPRYGASFTRRDDDHFILHGGLGFGGMPMFDTWEYDAVANAWADLTSVDPAASPPARGLHGAIDGGPNAPNGLYVMGGQGTGGAPIGSVFAFGRFPATWWEHLAVPGAPAARTQASLERLSVSTSPPIDRFLFFGGSDGTEFVNTADVYTIDWSLPNPSWSPLAVPSGTPRPPARGRHASMSWQGANGMRVLVFGGAQGAGQPELADTWILMEGGRP